MYIGQSIKPDERENQHENNSEFWKKMTNPKMEVLYYCLRRNMNFYEKREIYDAAKSDLECVNKQHNFNVLEVSTSDYVKEEIKKREMPRGVRATKYGKYQVRKMIKGEQFNETFDTLALAIEFLEGL